MHHNIIQSKQPFLEVLSDTPYSTLTSYVHIHIYVHLCNIRIKYYTGMQRFAQCTHCLRSTTASSAFRTSSESSTFSSAVTQYTKVRTYVHRSVNQSVSPIASTPHTPQTEIHVKHMRMYVFLCLTSQILLLHVENPSEVGIFMYVHTHTHCTYVHSPVVMSTQSTKCLMTWAPAGRGLNEYTGETWKQ